MDGQTGHLEQYGLSAGKLIYINHISLKTPALSVVKAVFENHITVNCSEHLHNIMFGDPIICKYISNGTAFVVTGDISEVHNNNSFSLFISSADKYQDSRRGNRFGVSLNAVVAGIDCLDYICSTVKSISLLGICINSRNTYEIGGELMINILIINEEVINLIGVVTRRTPISNYFEYGIEIYKIDSLNTNKLQKYIKYLEDEERKFLEVAMRD